MTEAPPYESHINDGQKAPVRPTILPAPLPTLPPPPVTDPVVEMDTDADMPDAPNEVAHRLTLLPHLHSKR